MSYPRLEIDIKKIKYNADKMIGECKNRGIDVAAVTKGFCANENITKALIESGVDILADSRIQNLKKLSGFNIPKMLIRIPMLSEVSDVVKYSDISLVSELETSKKLSSEAIRQNKIHNIILMVDLGDLREGIFYEDEIYETVKDILLLKGINLLGVGTNLLCYGGVIPTKDNLSKLVNIKKKIENDFNINLKVISGGSSGTTHLFKNNEMPEDINQLRLGCSLTMGIGLNDDPIEGLYTDALKLVVEVVSIKPDKTVICAIGRDDVNPNYLIPNDEYIDIIDADSDHLILNINECTNNYSIGDKIKFNMNYGAFLSTMVSQYVHKVCI